MANSKSTQLYRGAYTTGKTELDMLLDRIMSTVNELQKSGVSSGTGDNEVSAITVVGGSGTSGELAVSQRILNNSGTAISKGTLLGVSAAGTLEPALAGASVAHLISMGFAAPSVWMPFTQAGLVSVLVESGAAPAAGSAAYVSATEGGRATNVEPAASQSIGTFWGIVAANGLALVLLDGLTGAAASSHSAVALDANADTLLSLTGQTLGLDVQAANLVLAGPETGDPAVPTMRALTPTDIVEADPIFAVSPAGGITAEDIALWNLGGGSSHDPVTLDAFAETFLSLSGQLIQLDAVEGNTVWAGDSMGATMKPYFRKIVTGDLPIAAVSDGDTEHVPTCNGVFDAIAAAGLGDHGELTGLEDDDHTQYIKHALATTESDFLAASGAGAFVKKTLAETKTILGITGLLNDGMADALHRHSELSASDGDPNPALAVDAAGKVGIGSDCATPVGNLHFKGLSPTVIFEAAEAIGPGLTLKLLATGNATPGVTMYYGDELGGEGKYLDIWSLKTGVNRVARLSEDGVLTLDKMTTAGFVKNTTGGILSGGNSVVAADVAFSATDKILGRATAGAGAGEEIACTAAGRALLDDADAAAQRSTLGITGLMDDSMADALHRHSELSASDGSPNPALTVDGTGKVRVGSGSATNAFEVSLLSGNDGIRVVNAENDAYLILDAPADEQALTILRADGTGKWTAGRPANTGDYRLYSYAGFSALTAQYATGYVGILNANPSVALDVTGAIKASGALTAGASTLKASAEGGTPLNLCATSATYGAAGDLSLLFYQDALQTTNVAPLPCLTIPIPENSICTIEAVVTAINNAAPSSGAGYKIIGTYHNDAGTATIIGALGAPVTIYSAESDAAWAATLVPSGANVQVLVTGKAATTVNWSVTATRHIAYAIA
jgi:hypothetical protein